MAIVVDVVRTRGSDAIVLWGARHGAGGLAVGDDTCDNVAVAF